MLILKSKIKIGVLFIALSLFTLPAHSSGGGGGGSAEAPKATENLSTQANREYREKSAKLSGLEAKITDLNTQLSQLVELKKKETDIKKIRLMMDELVIKTKERNKAAADHRALKKYLLYRFPNLGEAIHQRYGTHEEASIEELEQAQGLNELLDETKILIQTKYAPLLKKAQENKNDIVTPPKKAEKEPLRLVK